MAGGAVLDWAGHAEIVGRVSLTAGDALSAVGIAGKVDVASAVAESVPIFAAEAGSGVAGGTGIQALKNHLKHVGRIIFDNLVPFFRVKTVSLNLYSTPFFP